MDDQTAWQHASVTTLIKGQAPRKHRAHVTSTKKGISARLINVFDRITRLEGDELHTSTISIKTCEQQVT